MGELAANPDQNPNRRNKSQKAKPKASKPAPKKKESNQPKSPRKRGGFFSGLFMALLSLGLFCFLGGIGGIVAILYYYGSNLPDYSALSSYDPPIVTRAYASDGRLLAEFAVEKRVFIPVAGVPKLVINAFLSAEDKNFYTHPGIDLMGVAGAAVKNIQNFGSDQRLKGASTITQQVAKNFLLLDEVENERGNLVAKVGRKIREAILSFRIEQALTKDQILELYLNEIYLGARSYGIAAASLEYFNKPLDELTLEEAAYLAGLPKAPSNYSPAITSCSK